MKCILVKSSLLLSIMLLVITIAQHRFHKIACKLVACHPLVPKLLANVSKTNVPKILAHVLKFLAHIFLAH